MADSLISVFILLKNLGRKNNIYIYKSDFCGLYFSISDRGGGIPHNIVNKIWHYNFTTSGVYRENNKDEVLFSEVMAPQSDSVPGKMHG